MRDKAWELLLEAERLYDGAVKAEIEAFRKLDKEEAKKRRAQFLIDYPEYVAAFDTFCSFLSDNFVREMTTDEEKATIAEASYLLKEVAIEDLPDQDVSDLAFPVLIIRAALFPDRIAVLLTPAWNNLAKKFTRIVMAA